jgi:hypothetical protein
MWVCACACVHETCIHQSIGVSQSHMAIKTQSLQGRAFGEQIVLNPICLMVDLACRKDRS